MGGGAEEMEGESSIFEGGNIWNKPLPDNVSCVSVQPIQLRREGETSFSSVETADVDPATYLSGCRGNDKELPHVELVSDEVILGC